MRPRIESTLRTSTAIEDSRVIAGGVTLRNGDTVSVDIDGVAQYPRTKSPKKPSRELLKRVRRKGEARAELEADE